MNLTAAPAFGTQTLDAQALAPEDILVTHLHADPVGGWNSKFR